MHALRFTAAALAAFACHAALADTMRCGNHIVSEGDSPEKVRSICGEPAKVETRSILRRPTFELNGRDYSFGNEMVEVPVEIWTYNFGPNKLMRRIRFVDGKIEEIETLEYGYREKN